MLAKTAFKVPFFADNARDEAVPARLRVAP